MNLKMVGITIIMAMLVMAMSPLLSVMADPTWSSYYCGVPTRMMGSQSGYDSLVHSGSYVFAVIGYGTGGGGSGDSKVGMVYVFNNVTGAYIKSYELSTGYTSYITGCANLRVAPYSDGVIYVTAIESRAAGIGGNVERWLCDGSGATNLGSVTTNGLPAGATTDYIFQSQLVKTSNNHYVSWYFGYIGTQGYYKVVDWSDGVATSIPTGPSSSNWYGLPTILRCSDTVISLICKNYYAYYNVNTRAITEVYKSQVTFTGQQWDRNQPMDCWISQASPDGVSGLFTGPNFYQGFECYTLNGINTLQLTSFYYSGTIGGCQTMQTFSGVKGLVNMGQMLSMYQIAFQSYDPTGYYRQYQVNLNQTFGIINYTSVVVGSVESSVAGSTSIRYPQYGFDGISDMYVNLNQGMGAWGNNYGIGIASTGGVTVFYTQYELMIGSFDNYVNSTYIQQNAVVGENITFVLPKMISNVNATDQLVQIAFAIGWTNITLNVTAYLTSSAGAVSSSNPLMAIGNQTVTNGTSGVFLINANYQTNLNGRYFAIAITPVNQTQIGNWSLAEPLVVQSYANTLYYINNTAGYPYPVNPLIISGYNGTYSTNAHANGWYLFCSIFTPPTNQTSGTVTGQTGFTWTFPTITVENQTLPTIPTNTSGPFFGNVTAWITNLGLTNEAFGVICVVAMIMVTMGVVMWIGGVTAISGSVVGIFGLLYVALFTYLGFLPNYLLYSMVALLVIGSVLGIAKVVNGVGGLGGGGGGGDE